MDSGRLFLLSLIFLVNSVGFGRGALPEYHSAPPLNRGSFPAGFLFGTSSAAYQYEGAAHEGGRGPSIWDTFTKKYPEKIDDRSSGVVAEDFYHRYKEDVGIMKDVGFNSHRFSISWSRLLPRGNITGGVNREGVEFYNHLINELQSKGMQPLVTIFHWDLPQVLEDDYGGFLNPQIVNDFRDYAELCYREFGDRVKHWITINEPQLFSTKGYADGEFAPGRCSKWYSLNCTGGDSATEPYVVAHHQLLAHAAAVKVYRDKYQVSQKGQIGITLNSQWYLPYRYSENDNGATNRALAFSFGWFIEPLRSGSYPPEMVNNVQQRLPKFSKEQSLMVKGSFDFIGLNYYTSYYAANALCSSVNIISYMTDSRVILTGERNGVPIGPKAAPDWLYVYPQGIRDLLIYTKKKLNSPPIYITENGVGEFDSGKVSLEDNNRINYHHHHLLFVQSAIRNGVDVRGYFVWSLLDNFQWSNGYTVRFGIVYVDYKNGLKRYPKSSAKWFKKFLLSYNKTVCLNIDESYIGNNVRCTELLLST